MANLRGLSRAGQPDSSGGFRLIQGHKLASYEIQDEESRDDGNRWFAWILREEDYKRSRNWLGSKVKMRSFRFPIKKTKNCS
jgi:hypothetical protein